MLFGCFGIEQHPSSVGSTAKRVRMLLPSFHTSTCLASVCIDVAAGSWTRGGMLSLQAEYAGGAIDSAAEHHLSLSLIGTCFPCRARKLGIMYFLK